MHQRQDSADPRRTLMPALVCLAALSVATALAQAGFHLTALLLCGLLLLGAAWYVLACAGDHSDDDDHPGRHSGGSRLARLRVPVDDEPVLRRR